jgi:BRCT domain type II-containing protein
MISFRYKDAKGSITDRELVQWSETLTYIQGRSSADTFPKTFRKDRIVEVLSGSELLLGDAAPAAPKLKANIHISPAAQVEQGFVPNPKSPPGGISQILFTGFAAAQRADLEGQAQGYGLKVMQTASKSLTFLCYGSNAGPSKVAKAQQAGAFIIDGDEFMHLMQTGELPQI